MSRVVFVPNGDGSHTGPPCPACGTTRYLISAGRDAADVQCDGCLSRWEQAVALEAVGYFDERPASLERAELREDFGDI